MAKLLDVDLRFRVTRAWSTVREIGHGHRVGHRRGTGQLVVDNTGLNVFGEEEWKVRQHGRGKRRDCRKLRLAIDPDAHTTLGRRVIDSPTHDGTAALPLLDQIDAELQTLFGDGACDQ
ncbi:MAG: transposase [Pirellulales bacterium]